MPYRLIVVEGFGPTSITAGVNLGLGRLVHPSAS